MEIAIPSPLRSSDGQTTAIRVCVLLNSSFTFELSGEKARLREFYPLK
jgi:hypothetical protein